MKMIIVLFAALTLCLSACTSPPVPPDIAVQGYDRLIEERGPGMDADRLELIVLRRNQFAKKAGIDLIEVPTFEGAE